MAEKQPQGLTGLASVLAKNLNDIEDLPNFVAPPAGIYKLLIEACGQKVINEKTTVVVEYKFLEMKTLNEQPDDLDTEELKKIQWGKDKMSEAFYFDDPERIDTTLGVLKKKYGPLGAVLGTTNLMEILEKMVGMTIEAQVGRRQDDKDKSKFYPYTRVITAAA